MGTVATSVWKWGMVMDRETYRDWWPLHLRVACGERLSPEERRAYEAGLQELYDDEALPRETERLRDARVAVASLEEERSELDARRRRLDEEIEALERLLAPPHDLSRAGR